MKNTMPVYTYYKSRATGNIYPTTSNWEYASAYEVVSEEEYLEYCSKNNMPPYFFTR